MEVVVKGNHHWMQGVEFELSAVVGRNPPVGVLRVGDQSLERGLEMMRSQCETVWGVVAEEGSLHPRQQAEEDSEMVVEQEGTWMRKHEEEVGSRMRKGDEGKWRKEEGDR